MDSFKSKLSLKEKSIAKIVNSQIKIAINKSIIAIINALIGSLPTKGINVPTIIKRAGTAIMPKKILNFDL